MLRSFFISHRSVSSGNGFSSSSSSGSPISTERNEGIKLGVIQKLTVQIRVSDPQAHPIASGLSVSRVIGPCPGLYQLGLIFQSLREQLGALADRRRGFEPSAFE